MPQEWIDDAGRRKKAGVREDTAFRTKPEMALEMIQQAAETVQKARACMIGSSLSMNPGTVGGFERSILIRRSKSAPREPRAYICFAPVNTPKQKLAEVAGRRWTVETCFKESKSEVGLDQYEVRSYDGWYRHITFACLALAF